MHGYAGHRLSGRLADRTARLSARARSVLEAMSCLGTLVDLEVLATACGHAPAEVLASLRGPADEGLVVFDPLVEGSVRFAHDLVQQGVHAQLGDDRRARLQLEMARRLLAAGAAREAAEQYLACCDHIGDATERHSVARLFLQSAQTLGSRGMFEPASVYLAAGSNLAQGGDAGLRHAILAARHKALMMMGRFAESDRLYQELQESLPDPVGLAGPTVTQAIGLHRRSLDEEAKRICWGLLRRLGAAATPDGAQFHPAEELDRIAARIRSDAETGNVNARRATDAREVAVANVMRHVTTGYFSAEGLPWLRAQAEYYRRWLEHGSTPMPANPHLPLAGSLINFRQDFQAATLLGRQVIASAEACGFDEQTVLEIRHHFVSYLGMWSMPSEDCLEELLAVRRRFQALGTSPHVPLYGTVVAELMMQCESLAATETELDHAIDYLRRVADSFAIREAMFARRLVQKLRGREPDPADGPGGAFDLASIAASLTPVDAITLEHTRLRMALSCGDYDELLRGEVPPIPIVPWEEGQPVDIGMQLSYPPDCYLTQAVRCIEQLRREPGVDREARLLTVERFRAWFAARAAEMRTNFQHLAHLLEAEQAWLAGDFWKAVTAFDAALREVRQRRRPWHRAFITERAALFHLERGMEESGRHLMALAREAYANWGVQVKVRAMDAAHPWLARGAAAGQAPARSASGTPSSDALDLMGILRASNALSSQRSIDDLAARVTEILATLTGATRVTLIVMEEGGWKPAGREARELPESVVRYVDATREPLLVDDVAQDERFSRDPCIAAQGCRSLMMAPVTSQGEMLAMLLLENDVARAAFGAGRLDAVMLIAGQLAVSIGNARLNDELEERVRARTAELEAVQEQLVATARRAGMAQVASNVLHNVGNVLTSVNVIASTLRRKLRESPTQGLTRAVGMINAHRSDLGRYIAHDEQGRLLPHYLEQLDAAIRGERDAAASELDTLLRSVDYIGSIIGSQQAYAGSGPASFVEPVRIGEVLDEALRVNVAGTAGLPLKVVKNYGDVPALQLDKVRLLQIAVNLVANSLEAMEGGPAAGTLTLETGLERTEDGEHLRIAVRDTGHGIAGENLPRLFTHGFTTKKHGHGFGLHGAAIAAMEMGGTLTPHSDGEGRGASFTLRIPVRRDAVLH
jgi:C4-dicarboxylate-specific signal transduction histidine kinase